MAYSQKYALVQLLTPMLDDTEFFMADWPLHVTLADIFAVDLAASQFIAKCSSLLRSQASFTITTGKETTFGPPDHPVRVTLLEKTPEIQSLHTKIADLIESCGGTFNTPEYIRSGFVPHITIKDQPQLHQGDRIPISALTLIDMFPGGDWKQRKIITTLSLKVS